MKIIFDSPSAIHYGTIELSFKEVTTVLHALISERDKVVLAGGNQYGSMIIGDLDALISQIMTYLRRIEGGA